MNATKKEKTNQAVCSEVEVPWYYDRESEGGPENIQSSPTIIRNLRFIALWCPDEGCSLGEYHRFF